MTMSKRVTPKFFCFSVVGLCLAALAWQTTCVRSEEPKTGTEPKRAAVTGPQYTDQGELKRPTGYETWVFVGSNIGLEYGDAAKPKAGDDDKKAPPTKPRGNFHNVYINPEAYAEYAKTGKFPEKTVLILDIFQTEEREPRGVVTEGHFPGKHTGMAAAVKNSARPDGSKSDWAYYDFATDLKSAKAFPDKACYDCHVEHASDDNVWVQFYPTLRKHFDERKKTTKEAKDTKTK